jgi:hypothetical protein
LNLFFELSTSSLGDEVPVFNRATISRAAVIVVALSLTAAWTNAVAREFRAADIQNEDYPTVQALRYMGRLITDAGYYTLTEQTIGIHARMQGDPAAAALIERIRKVE